MVNFSGLTTRQQRYFRQYSSVFDNLKNAAKNRFNSIPYWYHSRVKLSKSNSSKLDFINANYVNGWAKTNKFIATEAPFYDTIDDFWDMVWQNESEIIVVLTKIMEGDQQKCHPYWATNVDDVEVTKKYIVRTQKAIEEGDYVIYRLELKDVEIGVREKSPD